MSKPVSVILLGEATTGKTSVVNRLLKDRFANNTEATIGASFMSHIFDKTKYNFWDTAGQERFLSLAPIYYRKGEIIILTFDTSSLDTIDRMAYYLYKIRGDIQHHFEVIIVGTKTDLTQHKIEYIDLSVKEKLEDFKDIVKDTDYIYVSSKTPTNFDKLLEKLKEKGRLIKESRYDDVRDDLVTIYDTEPTSTMSKISCGYCL
jgi:small GTP-binding protein